MSSRACRDWVDVLWEMSAMVLANIEQSYDV